MKWLEFSGRLGGFGSAVAEYLVEKDDKPTLTIMGLPDRIIEHGTQEELHAEVGIDANALVEVVKQKLVNA